MKKLKLIFITLLVTNSSFGQCHQLIFKLLQMELWNSNYLKIDTLSDFKFIKYYNSININDSIPFCDFKPEHRYSYYYELNNSDVYSIKYKTRNYNYSVLDSVDVLHDSTICFVIIDTLNNFFEKKCKTSSKQFWESTVISNCNLYEHKINFNEIHINDFHCDLINDSFCYKINDSFLYSSTFELYVNNNVFKTELSPMDPFWIRANHYYTTYNLLPILSGHITDNKVEMSVNTTIELASDSTLINLCTKNILIKVLK